MFIFLLLLLLLQVDFFSNRFVGTNLENPSFAGIARSMGAEGITVDKPDDVGEALITMLKLGRPGVLEVMVSQELAEPFRRDALAMPKRTMEKYKDCE